MSKGSLLNKESGVSMEQGVSAERLELSSTVNTCKQQLQYRCSIYGAIISSSCNAYVAKYEFRLAHFRPKKINNCGTEQTK